MKIKSNDPVAFALRTLPVMALPGALIAGFAGGPLLGIGFAAGSLLAWSSLWASRWAVAFSLRRSGNLAPGSALQLAFLAKLPVFGIVIFFTNSLGLQPILCFIVGYMLVYFALIVGAVRSGPAPASHDKEPD